MTKNIVGECYSYNLLYTYNNNSIVITTRPNNLPNYVPSGINIKYNVIMPVVFFILTQVID